MKTGPLPVDPPDPILQDNGLVPPPPNPPTAIGMEGEQPWEDLLAVIDRMSTHELLSFIQLLQMKAQLRSRVWDPSLGDSEVRP